MKQLSLKALMILFAVLVMPVFANAAGETELTPEEAEALAEGIAEWLQTIRDEVLGGTNDE